MSNLPDSSDSSFHLVEKIPNHLLNIWKLGPLRFAKSYPEVELLGEDIFLRWGDMEIHAKTSDCNYRLGRAWQMKRNSRSARPLIPFGDTTLILIDFPPLYRSFFGKIRSYNTAPVGYTKESLMQWNYALGNVMDRLRADR